MFKNICLGFVPVVVLTVGSACAQQYPHKPLRIVVGYTPGGAVDFTARLIGQKLAEQLGQPVVVENRPGATTAIATERVATAAPDGYTLLLIPTSTAIQSALRKNLPYDLKRDFASVSSLAIGPFALVVANIMAHTLIELAPMLVRQVAPGGTLLLSGILDFQGDDVEAAFVKAGLAARDRQREGEWVLIELVRA